MLKHVSEVLSAIVFAAVSYAALVAVLFVANSAGEMYSMPLLEYMACIVFALVLVNVMLKTFPVIISFDPSMQPSDVRQTGLVMGLLFTLLFFHPAQYSELAKMQWPLDVSIIDLIYAASFDVPYMARQAIHTVFVIFGMVGVFYIIMGIYVPFATRLGLLRKTADEDVEAVATPDIYELQQTIRKLENEIYVNEGQIEEVTKERNRMALALREKSSTEQAIRQELVGNATRLSVSQKELKASERELRKQAKRNDELHTALKDLEITVTDLRIRIHAQKAAPVREAEKSEAIGSLEALIDKLENK